jgi:hypothetical protein
MMGEDDANVPMLADDEPPLDEDEVAGQNESADDMGFIGQQPGDKNVKKQETIINSNQADIPDAEEEDNEVDQSAQEIQFNMAGGA